MRTKTTALLVLVAYLVSVIVLLGPAKPTVAPESSARVNIAQSVERAGKHPFIEYQERKALEKRERLAKERASRAKAREALEAKQKAAARLAISKQRSTPVRSQSVKPIASNSGANRQIGMKMAAARGWDGVQWTCLNNLWTKESGWSHTSDNPNSSAYGIPQSLPGSKMSSAGSDWRTNPATQIKWGLGYIKGRYGDPCGAWRAFLSKGWY